MKHYFTFSEAIKAGIPLINPTRYAYLQPNSACVIGTGAIAIHERVPDDPKEFECFIDEAAALYPYMKQWRAIECPAEKCGRYSGDSSLFAMAVHLNDVHKWHREEIAEWLEKEEEKLGFVTIEEVKPEFSLETVGV